MQTNNNSKNKKTQDVVWAHITVIVRSVPTATGYYHIFSSSFSTAALILLRAIENSISLHSSNPLIIVTVDHVGKHML